MQPVRARGLSAEHLQYLKYCCNGRPVDDQFQFILLFYLFLSIAAVTRGTDGADPNESGI